jgi:hypothetical protein
VIEIRERPLLRLWVSVQPRGEAATRWGWDSPNAAYVPTNLSFTTAMPGGFERLSTSLQRESRVPWPDLELLSNVTVEGPGKQIAWEGRISRVSQAAGYERRYEVEAQGWQAALEDNQGVKEIYVDQELGHWQQPPLAQRRYLLESSPPNNPISAGSSVGGAQEGRPLPPGLQFAINQTWTTPQAAEAWYYGNGVNVGSIGAYFHSFLPAGTWNVSMGLLRHWESFAQGAPEHVVSIPPTTSGWYQTEPASGYEAACIRLVTGTEGGAPGHSYIVVFGPVAVYGTSGIPLHGTGSEHEAPGVLASDVVENVIKRWAPPLQTQITPTTFVIPQAAWLEPTSPAEIIKAVTKYEILDWAVWEAKTFWMTPRGARARRWRARVGPAQLQLAGNSVQRIYNGVIVEYTDPLGVTRSVGPPGAPYLEPGASSPYLEDTSPTNPANRAGIKRYAKITMGTGTQPAAIAVGERFLEIQRQLERSGQAQLVGAVEDNQGNLEPAWAVRAGDEISFTDAADTSYRRIVQTSYDDSSKTNTIQLEQPPETLQALLERLQVVIQPLGYGG